MSSNYEELYFDVLLAGLGSYRPLLVGCNTLLIQRLANLVLLLCLLCTKRVCQRVSGFIV